ncbi:putative oxidoreductase [Abditibacterium utsteinense]|uniref:Putative oxidoreductase n=1 Tax=Abditibacterium utsteinense TaxID=1960156 RepID=A0A2S8STJ7_9BACT|nr:aldo/keto reductase [Abditibacterium utsteinense]PQV64121.1 putative oxidoreductase [Abditibacterium utsteinense]
MKQRNFSQSGKSVSEVGLGTWQIGGSWGEVSEDESLAILREAYQNGVTFFDTANVYGDGRSEKLIGRFLRESGAKDVFVATKLGRGPEFPDVNEAILRGHTEGSLERLGVESLDLTQLHCVPTEELRRGEVFETLRKLKAEGKIQKFGASVESMEEAHLCLQQDGLASLQIIFNIFRQKPIADLFAAAQAKNVALIVRLPLASGLLSGKMTPDTKFDKDDHRNFNRDGASFNVGETFAGLGFEKGVELAEQLKPLIPQKMEMAQMAQRWILDFPAVTTIIPGASKSSQVISNVSASEIAPLSEELHAQLREFYESKVKEFVRGPY